MSDHISVLRTTGNAETIRKARELAWIGCLMVAISPTGYVVAQLIEKRSFNPIESALFVGIPVLVLARLIIVAMQLGKNMNNHNFLVRMEPWRYPHFYVVARLLGFAENATASD